MKREAGGTKLAGQSVVRTIDCGMNTTPGCMTSAPSTDPLALYRMRDGLYAIDLLITAVVHLDVFQQLDRSPLSLEGLCSRLGTQKRPSDVMMTLLKSLELIEERSGLFHLTQLAREHLLPDSQWYVAPYYAGMKDRPVARDFLEVLRTGKPANWTSLRDEKAWAAAMEHETFAKDFTAAMDSRGVYLGQALARATSLTGRTCLLDVAGGSGIYSCCLAAANPELSAVILEKAPVDAIAKASVEKRGFGERITVHAGDMFRDAWPVGADVHLLSNVLHDWDEPELRTLLKRSFESLTPGGVLLIHDMHLNDAKTGPLPVAQYSSLLMCITEGKCYARSELEPMLLEAGFHSVEIRPCAADRSVMTAKKR